jgi:hypothetical protein
VKLFLTSFYYIFLLRPTYSPHYQVLKYTQSLFTPQDALFNDAVSISDYTASNRRMIRATEQWLGKDEEGSDRGLITCTVRNLHGRLRKSTKISQDSQYPDRDSDSAPLQYKSQGLLLQQACSILNARGINFHIHKKNYRTFSLVAYATVFLMSAFAWRFWGKPWQTCQDSRSPPRYLNQRCPYEEVEVLYNRPWRIVIILHNEELLTCVHSSSNILVVTKQSDSKNVVGLKRGRSNFGGKVIVTAWHRTCLHRNKALKRFFENLTEEAYMGFNYLRIGPSCRFIENSHEHLVSNKPGGSLSAWVTASFSIRPHNTSWQFFSAL